MKKFTKHPKAILAARGKKASDEYFKTLIAAVNRITGIPKMYLAEVTTRVKKAYWSADTVGVYYNPPVNRYYAQLDSVIMTEDVLSELDSANIEYIPDRAVFIASLQAVEQLPEFSTFAVPADLREYRRFWAATAKEYRSGVIGYGCDTDPEDKTNLRRIAERLGERNFYEYYVGACRGFSSYGALKNALISAGVPQNEIASEADLISAGNEGRYFVARV